MPSHSVQADLDSNGTTIDPATEKSLEFTSQEGNCLEDLPATMSHPMNQQIETYQSTKTRGL